MGGIELGGLDTHGSLAVCFGRYIFVGFFDQHSLCNCFLGGNIY